jgi:hypothetical protein
MLPNTLSKLTPAAAAVIVGVAALLALLVYLKVDGAQVAAVGYATTLVALFTAGTKAVSPPEASTPTGDPSEAPTLPPPPDKPVH